MLLLGLAGSVVFYTLFGVATVYQSLAGLFIARIGAGIAGATISTAQAYIADTHVAGKPGQGDGADRGGIWLGIHLRPAVGMRWRWRSDPDQPGPGPGYLAAALSAGAFALALFKLPESLDRSVARTAKHWLDVPAFVRAMRTPSIGPLLVALFICILSFANFETTLSLLLKGETARRSVPFHREEVGWTFAYIGVTLTFAQGVLVRRMAGHVSEGRDGQRRRAARHGRLFAAAARHRTRPTAIGCWSPWP